jgi:hypothetical protein
MMFRATRLVLYPLFVRNFFFGHSTLRLLTLTQFASSTVLLGLTAYRIHYTKSLDHPDILTTRTHFYGAYSSIPVTSEIPIFYFRSQDRGAHDGQHSRSHLFTCNVRLVFILFSYFFINSYLLRLGALLTSLDIIIAEHLTIWILWIFFLITAALVTVCSRPSSFSAVLTPYYRNDSLISNGAEVTKSVACLRL